MTTLFDRLSKINSTNPYFPKDLAKSKKANKFIGQGSAASSTNKYRVAAGDLANCGSYIPTDIVFVSVEGARMGRIDPDFEELDLAIQAGVTFVMDTEADRTRYYNTGERQVAFYLKKNGYQDENGKGIWKKVV